MLVGEKIKLTRNEKKISLRGLAQLTGLSKTTLNDIENSKITNHRLDTIEKIAAVLEINISELLDECDDSVSNNFLKSIARAKTYTIETQEEIASFINRILEP